MRTTDDIMKDLQKRADAGEDVRQLLLSTQALVRLRAERAAAAKAGDLDVVRGLDLQIETHRGLVDEDVDERVAAEPKKNSTKLVDAASPPVEA